MSVYDVFGQLWRSPRELLLRRWNWKSAVFSSIIRGIIFFCCNLKAGWSPATSAMLAEFVYRSMTAGFYGALTQAFRKVRPTWTANLAVVLLLPLASHSLEAVIHTLRHTPRLFVSIMASVCFTIISTLFNLYAMRRGALIVGEDSRSAADDLRRIPALMGGFVASGPVALYRWLVRLPASARVLSSGLALVAAFLPSARLRGADGDKHETRTYQATATVTLMSIGIFTRKAVGGGFASLDETGDSKTRQIHLRFLSGSIPEHAHGLNRLGYIEERIEETGAIPAVIRSFGFITANREESLAQAKAALMQNPQNAARYVAAESLAGGQIVEYSVRDMLLPAHYRWSDGDTLLNEAEVRFHSAPVAKSESKVQPTGRPVPDTFLDAIVRAIRSERTRQETVIVHNGKTFSLRMEKAADEKTGEELARAGLGSAVGIMRLKGSIRGQNGAEETSFKLWFDGLSANPLPLRFEFHPKSYLKLVFDAVSTPDAEAMLGKKLASPFTSMSSARSFVSAGKAGRKN